VNGVGFLILFSTIFFIIPVAMFLLIDVAVIRAEKYNNQSVMYMNSVVEHHIALFRG